MAGILEVGASRAWVVPSVVGAVEDIVDNLKGSGRVGLIDFVQVGPGGDGEGSVKAPKVLRSWGFNFHFSLAY